MEQVSPDQVTMVHPILEAAAIDLKQRYGLDHWEPPYPLELLRRDAAQNMVFACYDEGNLVATMTLSVDPPPYVAAWQTPACEALYVSHLAVLPGHQRQGIGTRCMRAAEHIALQIGVAAVRLDAYAQHHDLLIFYERLGYGRAGVLQFGPYTGICFEKRV